MRKIENKYQALVQALTLAITEPTDELSAECGALADEFASGMTAEQIESAKADALKLVNSGEFA